MSTRNNQLIYNIIVERIKHACMYCVHCVLIDDYAYYIPSNSTCNSIMTVHQIFKLIAIDMMSLGRILIFRSQNKQLATSYVTIADNDRTPECVHD